MMKIAALFIALAVAVTAVPAFAGGEGSAPSSREKSPFQIVADTMTPGETKAKNKLIELNEENLLNSKMFQNMSDGINEGSKKAKAETLRSK